MKKTEPIVQSLKPARVENPGYHENVIPRGVLGESSKLLEEVLELIDAEEQGCRVMALVELSDLMGAIFKYLEAHHPDTSVHDLIIMNTITERAFRNGYRR